MDSGAVGSLVADYPLQLKPAGDLRISATINALMKRHFLHGGFFQDMIHSGINAYLTLDIAQTLLRNGDDHWRALVDAVADLASSTGQWPEAIHPRTGGGCMGDGQHGWAAAEWVMMIRNCFTHEEFDHLVIGSDLFSEWFEQDSELSFGPTLTPWRKVTVRVIKPRSAPSLMVDGQWHDASPSIRVCVPGFESIQNVPTRTLVPLTRIQATDSSRRHTPSQSARQRGDSNR